VTAAAVVSLVSLAVVGIAMLGELRVSLSHERVLLRDGAIEPPDPVYATMRWAYPATFVAMAVEGSIGVPAPLPVAVAGFLVFVVAKALKYWAIASLGTRWTFRVLVLPGAPLVTSGPYRWFRHPNYIGVVGELVGFALLLGAWATGALSLAFFGYLLRRRIAAEDRALY
jgi:methyltransferase